MSDFGTCNFFPKQVFAAFTMRYHTVAGLVAVCEYKKNCYWLKYSHFSLFVVWGEVSSNDYLRDDILLDRKSKQINLAICIMENETPAFLLINS